MISSIVRERDCQLFKFWLDGNVLDGMTYQNELFWRYASTPIERRFELFRQACQMAQRGAVVVTTSDEHCSLWLSLRSRYATRLDRPQYSQH